MIAMWLMGVALAIPAPAPAPAPVPAHDALAAAAEAEIARAMEMSLPEQPGPYWISVEVLDGEVATAASAFGSLTAADHGPYRTLRTEVRVGEYAFDNGNFDVSFGERDGVRGRALPEGAVPAALEREIWLSLDGAYKGAAEQYSAKVAAREGRSTTRGADLAPVQPLVTQPIPRPRVDGDAVADLTAALTAEIGDRPELEEANAMVRDWQGSRLIVSTEGHRAWVPTGFTVVRVEAIARADDGARLRDARWWVARDPAGLPSRDEMLAEVRSMADHVVALRDAPVETDYLGPVLFESAASVELFRQLLLPEVGGTPPPEAAPDPYGGNETGPPTARIGRRLLPEGWRVVDDAAAAPGEAGHYAYDQEGVGVQRVELVRDGVVRDLLMSRVPREAFHGSTGHGRSLGSSRREALPAVVTVTPARPRSDAALRRRALALARQAGLPYVLVIRRVEPPALAEDFRVAFSGEGPLPGLTRPLEAVRLYPDGREEAVRGLEFVGVDRRAMRDIAAAGAVGPFVGVMDAAAGPRRFSVGAVGGVPASWAVPPVVITELELRGQGGREPRVLSAPPVVASQ